MKLEIALALFLGVVLGLGAMIGIVFVTRTMKVNSTPPPTSSPPPTTSPELFEITSPLDQSAMNNNKFEIGIRNPNVPALIVSSEVSDQWIYFAKTSELKVTVSPLPGINDFTVFNTITHESRDIQTLNVTGINSPGKFTKALVTDITREAIQAKFENGTIGQILLSANTKALTIARDIKETPTSEIAIGDTIFAVDSKYIVVFNSPNTPLAREVVNGKITSFDKTVITLSTKDSETSLQLNKQTKFIGINPDGTIRTRTKLVNDDLQSDVYCVVTGSSVKLVRTIFIKATK